MAKMGRFQKEGYFMMLIWIVPMLLGLIAYYFAAYVIKVLKLFFT